MSKLSVRACIGALMVVAMGSAFAQSSLSYKNTCTSIGGPITEALPGRDGQAMGVGNYVCTVEGGPLDGATLTGQVIWLMKGMNGESVSGNGIARKPGAQAVYDHTMGKIKYITNASNQVIGLEGEGKAVYRMTSGGASPLDGKTTSYTFKSTGPNRFVVEGKFD